MSACQIIDEVKQLYHYSKLKECINKVDELNNSNLQLDFTVYQTVQLYKCLSFFQISNQNEGKKCIQQLIKQSYEKKGAQVDEIDLMIQIQYQILIVDFDEQTAIENNPILYQYMTKYDQQNRNKTHYNKVIYNLGQDMFNFIEQLDQKEQNMVFFKQSYDTFVNNEFELGYIFGCMLKYLGKYDEQLIFCKQIYEINPYYPGIAGLLAQSYQYLQQLVEAEKYYKFAEQCCPENTNTLVNASEYYQEYHKEKKQKQHDYLLKAYGLNHKSGNICLNYGRFVIQNIEQEIGENIIIEGMKNDPSCFNLYQFYADIQFNNQNIDYGLQILKEFVAKNPKNLQGLYYLGNTLYINSHYDEAQEYFQKYQYLSKRNSVESQKVMFERAACFFHSNLEEESLHEFFKLLNSSKIQIETIEITQFINNILNSSDFLSHQNLLQIITNYHGPIQMRLNLLMEDEEIEIKPENLIVIKQEQNIFIEILSILAHRYYIQPYLLFQSNISYWDIFIN